MSEVSCPVCGTADLGCLFGMHWKPAYGDPCPACGRADLEQRGGKHRCPECLYIQPCCQP